MQMLRRGSLSESFRFFGESHCIFHSFPRDYGSDALVSVSDIGCGECKNQFELELCGHGIIRSRQSHFRLISCFVYDYYAYHLGEWIDLCVWAFDVWENRTRWTLRGEVAQ